jgi:hypothetical protein
MGDASAAVCKCGHPFTWHDVTPERACVGRVSGSGGSDCRCRGFTESWAFSHGPDPDPINAPAHYTRFPGGVEPIDIAEHLSFNLGNALKYVARAGHKGDAVEDLKKARFYIDREIARITAMRKETRDGQ